MSNYAKVVNGKVVNVIRAEPDFFETFVDDEPGTWVQTSYNTHANVHYDPETNEPDGGVALRKNYAGIGYTYDKSRDAFIPPRPFDSWQLNEDTCDWEPPTPVPNDGNRYQWDEETIQWVLL